MTSEGQAYEVGYWEGSELRSAGASARDLHTNRERFFEFAADAFHLRAPHVPFYTWWKAGFDAGYLGRMASNLAPLLWSFADLLADFV